MGLVLAGADLDRRCLVLVLRRGLPDTVETWPGARPTQACMCCTVHQGRDGTLFAGNNACTSSKLAYACDTAPPPRLSHAVGVRVIRKPPHLPYAAHHHHHPRYPEVPSLPYPCPCVHSRPSSPQALAAVRSTLPPNAVHHPHNSEATEAIRTALCPLPFCPRPHSGSGGCALRAPPQRGARGSSSACHSRP